jgi:DNA-binding GntR family transcriptional regulator
MPGDRGQESASPASQAFEDDQPLEFQTKSQVVYETLRRWILHGRLAPGQTIDQEGLATSLRVSRMPLRQALLKLEADGLISIRPHRSAVIVPLSPSVIEEIYATRTALEGMLAEVGARRSDPGCLARMAGLLRQMEAATAAGEMDAFVDLDRRFHAELYSVSGYERACEILDRLRDSSDRYVLFYAAYQHGAEQSLDEHRHLLDACRAGRALDVRHITERHILRGADTLRRLAMEQSGMHDPGSDVHGNSGAGRAPARE